MTQALSDQEPSVFNSTKFPRRILLAVTGLSPQIVTETLYAQWCASPDALPTEVHLITTKTGADHARLNLLSPAIGWLERLRREYDLPEIHCPASNIHVITGKHGAPLDDIRTPDHNVYAADFITDLVRVLVMDEDSSLHVSIAGGRKSMGYFVGYALSLFGRPQDRLSHVLVSAPFEGHPEFYYPTRTEHPIHVGPEGKKIAYDCRTAEVDLAWIPFVRLRSAHHRPLVENNARFSDCVSAVQEAIAERELILDLQGKQICAGGQIIRLPPTELAFLSWFARRAKANLPPLPGITFKDPEGRGSDYRAHFVAELERIDPLLDEDGRTLRAAGLRDGMLPEYFNTKNSTLNRKLKQKLGALAARPYLVLQDPDGSGYALALPPEAIRYAPLQSSEIRPSR